MNSAVSLDNPGEVEFRRSCENIVMEEMMNEIGDWNVNINDGRTGVVMSFAVTGDDGVESFTTTMPPENALAFGTAVVLIAGYLL